MAASAAPAAARPFTTSVAPEWLDYNGHVNDAAYAKIAALANEELCVDLGMSQTHQKETGRAFYTVELTITYLHEITHNAELRVFRTIVGLGTKSMTVAADFHVGDLRVATTKHVYVLVDSRARSSAPLTTEERSRIEPLVGRSF